MVITGVEILMADDSSLATAVRENSIFTRLFPEAKLRVIEALKKQGEVTAMTGDGVNDAPALKSANIGIAMGKKGSEIAKQASAMILVDDDLGKMVDAVASGRRIYGNLKKAIQYIISIHLPIILIVFLPLVLGWIYPVIFSPVHVIFLELIMGPTCSIIYENEPGEQNTMDQPPRPVTRSLFNWNEMLISLIQGAAITIGLVAIYWYAADASHSLKITTALVFITLITANIGLTLVNRSYYYSLVTTLKYRNILIPLMIAATTIFVGLLFYIPPFRDFFDFGIPTSRQVILAIAVGFASVFWFEIYKWGIRKKGLRVAPPVTTI
jgi:Ca2+-transporting ATPase